MACSSVCSAAPGAFEPVARISGSSRATGLLRVFSGIKAFRREPRHGEWPEGSRKLARIGKIFHTGLRGLSQYDITSGNLGGNGTFGAGILQPMGKSDRIS